MGTNSEGTGAVWIMDCTILNIYFPFYNMALSVKTAAIFNNNEISWIYSWPIILYSDEMVTGMCHIIVWLSMVFLMNLSLH